MYLSLQTYLQHQLHRHRQHSHRRDLQHRLGYPDPDILNRLQYLDYLIQMN